MAETTESSEHEPARDEPASGSRFSGLLVAETYRVGARLGSGGMADVFEAEHVRLGSRVAIKFLRMNRSSEPRAVERFRREGRRAVAASSEHLVSVFDCGELPDGTPFFVMERLLGEDLRRLLERERRLSSRRAVKLASDACQGLSIVHAAGIVHRDLKPANLFVVKRPNGGELCKILDFGVAKLVDSDATRSGALLGTVRYMAPEQLEDAASVRAPADLYSIGAILYECLCGVPAHSGASLHELMFHILHRDPRPLREFCAIPGELERVVLRALSRDPRERYSSADELALALAPFGAITPSATRVEDTQDDTVNETRSAVARAASTARGGKNAGWVLVGGALTFAAGFATASALRERQPGHEGFTSGPAATAEDVVASPLPEVVAPPPLDVSRPSASSARLANDARAAKDAPAKPEKSADAPGSAASSAAGPSVSKTPRTAAPERRGVKRRPDAVAAAPKPLSERIEASDPYAE